MQRESLRESLEEGREISAEYVRTCFQQLTHALNNYQVDGSIRLLVMGMTSIVLRLGTTFETLSTRRNDWQTKVTHLIRQVRQTLTAMKKGVVKKM